MTHPVDIHYRLFQSRISGSVPQSGPSWTTLDLPDPTAGVFYSIRFHEAELTINKAVSHTLQ